MSTTTATAEPKTKTRYKTLEEMTQEEKEKFEKKSELQKEEYNARLNKQAADDRLAELRVKQDEERKEKAAARTKENGIKDIIKDVREGKLTTEPDALTPRFTALNIPTEEHAKLIERVKTDSVSKSKAVIPAKPAYELVHALATMGKDVFIEPTVSSPVDNTLANSLRRYGMITPVIARQAPDAPGKYVIMDGKRRFKALDADAKFPVIVVSGFPDEDIAERAEVTVNRVRSLNILSTANSLNRMSQRGIEDTVIRRDMGFKTGEIAKITSVINDLVPEISAILAEGKITPSVALSIAKLNKPLQKELVALYKERVKTNANTARLVETDVEGVRQKRAADSAQRDTPTLAGLAGSVAPGDAKGGEVDKGNAPGVSSSKSAAPKAGSKK